MKLTPGILAIVFFTQGAAAISRGQVLAPGGWFLAALIAVAYSKSVIGSGRRRTTTSESVNVTLDGMSVEDYADDAGKQLLRITGEFFAGTSVSPNGRYVAGARDSHYEGNRQVKGTIATPDVETGKELFVKRIPRPNNPSVADSGHCTLEDWTFSNALRGEFMLFNSRGVMQWSKKTSLTTSRRLHFDSAESFTKNAVNCLKR